MPTETELALESSLATELPSRYLELMDSSGFYPTSQNQEFIDTSWPGGPRGAGYDPDAVAPLTGMLSWMSLPYLKGAALYDPIRKGISAAVNKFYAPRIASTPRGPFLAGISEYAQRVGTHAAGTGRFVKGKSQTAADVLANQLRADTALPRWYNPLTLLSPRGIIPSLAMKPPIQALTKLTTPAGVALSLIPGGEVDLGDGSEPHIPTMRGVTPDLEERIGYNEADTLRQHSEIVHDPRSSSLQRSQSAQTLIESVANRPYIAPFISGGEEVKSSTEKVLDTFLPSAFNIKNIDQVKSEILGNIDFDLEMETEITPQTPEQYLQSIEQAGAVGEQIVPRRLFTRKPLRQYMPEYLESTGPEPDVAPSVWYTGEAPEVRTDLTVDQTAWDKAVSEGSTPEGWEKPEYLSGSAWGELKDRHDTRRHLDAIFGTDTAGSTDPTLDREQRLRQTVGDIIVPIIPSDTIRDAFVKYTDNKDTVQTLVDAKETSSVSETLKDLVNNELFMGARDSGQGALEAYNNPNVVFDEDKFDVLSQALVDKKANVDQLDAALELVRSAPEDDRVVESFTEQGLIDIGSQVESFADIPKAPPTPKAVSFDRRAEQKKAASDQRKRDKKAAAKRQAADKRAADKAAAKSKAMSKAQKRNIAKAAKAARAAEAAREAATKKAAEDQRRKDKEAQKIWDMHKKMQEQNKEQRAREEARRLALGYGSGGMWT